MRYTRHMHIQRAYKLRRGDLFPDAEVNACCITSHHPAQIHAEALAGRAAPRRAYMLACALGMFAGEKVVVEIDKRRLYVFIIKRITRHKGILQGVMALVVSLQYINEVKQVCRIECTMRKSQHRLQVCWLMMQDEFVRCVVHPLHQARAIVDDGCAITPGKRCSEEACYLYILWFGKAVRNGDRVCCDESRCIVKQHFFIQKRFDGQLVGRIHAADFTAKTLRRKGHNYRLFRLREYCKICMIIPGEAFSGAKYNRYKPLASLRLRGYSSIAFTQLSIFRCVTTTLTLYRLCR